MSTLEKHAASPKAMADRTDLGALQQAVELRQVNSLNTSVEQDHRFILPTRQSRIGLLFL